MENYAINPNLKIEIMHIGRENHPLLVIDDLLLDTNPCLTYAQQGSSFESSESDFYPGIRKLSHEHYSKQILERFESLFRDVFSIPKDYVADVPLSAYSIVTTHPNELRPIQCVPHIDSKDGYCLAFVHYLCDENFGGTSLYRHKSSGYENISSERMVDYFKTLKPEVIAAGEKCKGYFNNENKLFEKIGHVNAKFNRVAVYRSNSLHSANINLKNGFSADPLNGRLTIVSCVNFALPSCDTEMIYGAINVI